MSNKVDDLGDVELHLEGDEALVLLELLSRWTGEKPVPRVPASCFESPSESAVLHRLLGQLERKSSAVFRTDYLELLAEARCRIEEQYGNVPM